MKKKKTLINFLILFTILGATEFSILAQKRDEITYQGIEDSWSNDKNLINGNVKTITEKVFSRFTITVNNEKYDPNSLSNYVKFLYDTEHNLLKKQNYTILNNDSVKLNIEQKYFKDKFDEVMNESDAKFNEVENVITVSQYEDKKIVKKVNYKFDFNKNIIDINEIILDSSLILNYKTYENGKLIKDVSFNNSYLYEYDNLGRETSMSIRNNKDRYVPDMDSSSLDMSIKRIFRKDTIFEKTYLYKVDFETKKTYLNYFHEEIFLLKNNKKRKIKDISKSYSDENVSNTIFIYDNENKLVKEITFKDKKNSFSRRYNYDKNGNFIERYDDFEYPENLSKLPAYKANYVYDTYGNWTKRFFHEGETLISITERNIEFY